MKMKDGFDLASAEKKLIEDNSGAGHKNTN